MSHLLCQDRPGRPGDWRVDALHVATLELATRESPVYAFLLRSEGRSILVDAGTPTPELVRSRWKTGCQMGGPVALADALRAVGSHHEQIEAVILSHLHFDHAGALELFPEAQIVVHRDELFHAVDPVPGQRGAYNRTITAAVIGRRRPAQLLIVRDAEHELAPGVGLIHTPGHTPGTMATVVRTARGTIGLPSDGGERYFRWYPRSPEPDAGAAAPDRSMDTFTVPTMRSESERRTLDSMDRLSRACDIIVPSHDWDIPRTMPDQWWAHPALRPLGVSAIGSAGA